MSPNPPSRTSLADVIALIAASDLSPVQQRDQTSAVRTVARLLKAQPGDIAADPAGLRQRLAAVAPEAEDLSRGRWMNVRSLLGKALSLARTIQPSRSVQPVLPAWAQLLEPLDRNRAIRLKPLARCLSAQAILPADVTLDHLNAYQDAILKDRLRAEPERTWHKLAAVWNACRREVAGWPDVEIPWVSRRQTYTLPWSAFAPSLKHDVDAFLLRLSGADLSEDGPSRPAGPGTLKTREYHLRLAASVLVIKGVPVDQLRTLADLVTLERVKLVLGFLIERRGDSGGFRIGQMASFLAGVATHWVKLDDLELLRLKRLVSRFPAGRLGMTAKNRDRLRPLDSPEVVGKFLGLSERIRADVEKDKRPLQRNALKAQTAVAIAILQVAPIRIGNLVSIDMGRHLIKRGDNIYLVFEADEVKNKEPIDFVLPESVVDIIAWYAVGYRGALLRAPTQALFPGNGAGPKSVQALRPQISKAVFDYAGLKFNPHLARHAAGKIFLDQRPGQYEVVSRLLGHKSIATTMAIYTGAETRSAGQHYAKVIDGLRTAQPSVRQRRSARQILTKAGEP